MTRPETAAGRGRRRKSAFEKGANSALLLLGTVSSALWLSHCPRGPRERARRNERDLEAKQKAEGETHRAAASGSEPSADLVGGVAGYTFGETPNPSVSLTGFPSARKSSLRGEVRRQVRPIVRLGSGAKRSSLIRSSRTSASSATFGARSAPPQVPPDTATAGG